MAAAAAAGGVNVASLMFQESSYPFLAVVLPVNGRAEVVGRLQGWHGKLNHSLQNIPSFRAQNRFVLLHIGLTSRTLDNALIGFYF